MCIVRQYGIAQSRAAACGKNPLQQFACQSAAPPSITTEQDETT
jgi:hypothetical protein